MKSSSLLFILLACLVFASTAKAEPQVVDRIVATIGVDRGVVAGTAITRLQVIRRMRSILKQGNLSLRQLQTKDIKALFNKALQMLIQEVITDDVAHQLGLTISEQAVDQRIQQIKQRNGMNDQQLLAMIKNTYGFSSIREFKSFLKKNMLKERTVGLKVRSKVHVSDSEVRDIFLRRFKDGKLQPAVELAHIVIPLPAMVTLAQVSSLMAKMRAIRQQIITGKISFSEAARRFSRDATAQKGGVIGWYSYEELDPRIGAVVFSMKKGGVSDVVPGQRGFHIFKVLDKKWVPLKDPDEVRARIRYELFSKRLNTQFAQWIEEEKKRRHCDIRVKPEDLKAARAMLGL